MKNRNRIFSVLFGIWVTTTAIQAQTCIPDEFNVTMATPVSSRINWVGDSVEAILTQPLALSGQTSLPAGTLLKGKVTQVKSSQDFKAGMIRLIFQKTPGLPGQKDFSAQVATPDGWLRQGDRNTTVWRPSPTRSTRLLNQKVEQRLGSNRAVWASVLGMNQNTIPQVNSDDFMAQYNKNDVMVGAGDSLKLRRSCP